MCFIYLQIDPQSSLLQKFYILARLLALFDETIWITQYSSTLFYLLLPFCATITFIWLSLICYSSLGCVLYTYCNFVTVCVPTIETQHYVACDPVCTVLANVPDIFESMTIHVVGVPFDPAPVLLLTSFGTYHVPVHPVALNLLLSLICTPVLTFWSFCSPKRMCYITSIF